MRDYWKEIERQSAPSPLPATTLDTPPAPGTEPPLFTAVDTVPRWLKGALLAAGVVVLWLSYVISGYGRGSQDIPFRIGTLIAAPLIWPLIVLALFSIGKRFRTKRNRALILLWVWGLFILGHLSTINLHHRARARGPNAPSPASPAANSGFSSATTTQTARATPAPSSVAPAAPAATRAPVDEDFSLGSDRRFIRQIESAQEDRYRAIVEAYARACARWPYDAVLALERVRFIERFADSEDGAIKGAEEDLEAAVAYLTTRFPKAPGAVLYQLQRKFGPDFEAEANRHNRAVLTWPDDDRASFLLLRAQRTKDTQQQLTLARASFEASATAAAGLLMLQHLPKKPPTPETLRLLEHPVFRSAHAWEKLQVMNSLFDVGRSARALVLYQEIKTQMPGLVQTAETANRLAAAGHVGMARSLLAGLPTYDWNRSKVLRDRFHFEVEHGTAAEAAAAYRALRATGIAADPLLRERFTLLRKDLFAGWSFQDLAGVGLGGLLLITLLLVPAPLLLPVHYWSLLRARAGKPLASADARWGLREIWLAIVALGVVEMACIWLFQPEAMQTWWRKSGGGSAAIPAMSDHTMLSHQFTVWTGAAVVLGVALWWAQAWKILRRGEWSWGRTIGVVLAATLVLRITLLGYMALWPSAVDGELATFSPNTKQLCLALLKAGGPLGMIAVVAGLVPLLEEVFFRGVLLEGLAKHIPFGWANAAQALFFASVHENFRVLPFFFVFGIVCGWLARKSQTLLAPMLVHGLNNFTVCLVLMATNR